MLEKAILVAAVKCHGERSSAGATMPRKTVVGGSCTDHSIGLRTILELRAQTHTTEYIRRRLLIPSYSFSSLLLDTSFPSLHTCSYTHNLHSIHSVRNNLQRQRQT
jgi:hypothetical protein